MPTLNWIGKEAVVKHHKDVPYRLLEPVPELSCGDSGSGNLIVQGDNLHALKALLPRYAGQVKCIYIDPPYNTGNENWVYNDNVNSPEIRKWLGHVVGGEGETLDRHDRWLCMMYPRLVLLRQFLTEDGVIFISIDDNEVGHLRLILDEVFGYKNLIANVLWQKKFSPANDAKWFSNSHDHILVYAKRKDIWQPNLLQRRETAQKNYSNPDNDSRGDWTSSDYTCNKSKDERPNLYYSITNPNTGEEIWPKATAVWRYNRETHDINIKNNMVWWGKNGTNRVPRMKKFKFAVRQGTVPETIWFHTEVGNTQEARKEVLNFNPDSPFSTPKPVRLINRILEIGTESDSLVLDSFTGSGTTAHAVLKQNAADGGKRRFILVEMDDNIARNVTAERVRRVAQGYTNAKDERVEGLGGGFQFCKLSDEPLFTPDGQVRADVTFAQLAEFVWFIETGIGFTGKADSPLIGVYEGRAVYLLYNGIIKDKSVAGGNVLTGPVYESLPKFDGPKVIYAAACRLGAARLMREGIIFKQTPYALEV